MELTLNEEVVLTEEEVKENKRITFASLMGLGIVFAHLGWIIENIACIFAKNAIDSRFHLMPFIPEYALIPLAFYLLLKDPDDLHFFGKRVFKQKNILGSNLLCLGIIITAVFLGEEGVGNFMEWASGVVLWDYSSMPLAFSKYTCALSVFGFGIGAYLIFKFIYPPLFSFFKKASKKKGVRIGFDVVAVLMVIDAAIMIITTIITGNNHQYWEIVF